MKPNTAVSRAERDLFILRDEGAPASVLDAAEAAIASVKLGVPPPAWARDVIVKYAARRMEQSRYGNQRH